MFGIGLQELSVILVTALVIAFHIRMLVDLWHNPDLRMYRIIWTVVIVAIPFVGPLLYFWFVKVKL